MENISKYLADEFDEFLEIVNSGDKSNHICKSSEVDFSNGRTPDYTSEVQQSWYKLRLTYAYAYEYKLMYKEILKDIAKNKTCDDKLNILSIGCGNLVDYYAATCVLWDNALIYSNYYIDYKGIDIIDWSHKFKSRLEDNIKFFQMDILEYIENIDEYDFDVLFLPKSISELDNDAISKICEKFSTAKFEKDTVYIAIPLRVENEAVDMVKVNDIIKSLKINNYSYSSLSDVRPTENSMAICRLDYSFEYPQKILDDIKEEVEDCKKNAKCQAINKCIGRSPILKDSQVNFKIYKLERIIDDTKC